MLQAKQEVIAVWMIKAGNAWEGRTPADYCEQFKRSNKETGYVELKVREKRYKECVTSLQNLLKNGQCISTEDPKEVADYITGRKNLKDNPPSLNIEGEK